MEEDNKISFQERENCRAEDSQQHDCVSGEE
jgi:hypothetical protein